MHVEDEGPPHRESALDSTRKLWIGLAILLVSSFAVLLWAGGALFRAAPPVPARVFGPTRGVV